MGIIQDKAQLIAEDMDKNMTFNMDAVEKPKFILAIVVAIAELIYYLIEIYKECNFTTQEATASMQSGGIVERIRLRRAIRQHSNPDVQTHGDSLFNSTLTISKQTQEDEVSQMYEEVDVPLV